MRNVKIHEHNMGACGSQVNAFQNGPRKLGPELSRRFKCEVLRSVYRAFMRSGSSQVTSPINSAAAIPNGTVWRSTWPSRPTSFTVLQPTVILAGASMLPNEPPAVCEADNNSGRSPSNTDAFFCSAPNSTLELLLLPVAKAPRTPISGDTTGKAPPRNVAAPFASRKLIPQ